MTVQEVLGEGLGTEVFDLIAGHLGGSAQVRVAKTQVGWARRRGFAYLWTARRWHVSGAAPLVLTLIFRTQVHSPRWKEVTQTGPTSWNHHLEIWAVTQVDDEVLAWLDRAWQEAG